MKSSLSEKYEMVGRQFGSIVDCNLSFNNFSYISYLLMSHQNKVIKSRLSTLTKYWDKTPRNHKQLTFILLSHAIVVRRNSGGFRIVVSSLVCSLHEKMFWQTSRERDHGEDQHVEQHHPVHFTGHCRHHGAYIGRE